MAELKIQGLGESITEAVIGRWLKSVGDYVEADEAVLDLETDKVNVDVTAPNAGILSEQRFADGDIVHVGDVVGVIVAGERPVSVEPEVTEMPSPASTTTPSSASTTPSSASTTTPPSAAAPPSSFNTDVPERDASGRVLSPSMRRAARGGQLKEPATAAPRTPAIGSAQTVAELERVVPMSPLRKRIAERLVKAQQSSASLTTFNEVDLSNVIALRKTYKQQFIDTHGIKLGFMSFFVKAAVHALKDFPGVNAEVRDEAIVYKQFYDIGIAVGTDRGLVVPVLRNADQLSFADIEKGIVDLATKARNRKLVLNDLLGATFTITNGGIYGSMLSTPLLNYPQTGILGMHNIVERPMAINGSVEVRPIMYVALTYDHRVVDGKEAVRFLVALKERLEDPERMLLSI